MAKIPGFSNKTNFDYTFGGKLDVFGTLIVANDATIDGKFIVKDNIHISGKDASNAKIKIEDNNETNFGTLKIVVRTCKKSLPEDPPENSAFIQIWDTKFDKKKEEKKIFSGWMFSSSPSISAVNHAVYDVWVIDCMVSYIED